MALKAKHISTQIQDVVTYDNSYRAANSVRTEHRILYI